MIIKSETNNYVIKLRNMGGKDDRFTYRYL